MLDDLISLLIPLAFTIAAIFGVSWLMMKNAKPKGADLQFLTGHAAGEAILDYRVANACLSGAEPNGMFKFVMAAIGADKGLDPALELIRKMSGGLWVGGRVILTTHRIVFMPNLMNRAVHKELPVIALRLADITGATTRFGLVTNIADIETPAGKLTVRAYKMQDFAAKLQAARETLA